MPSIATLSRSLLTQVSQRRTEAYLIELNTEGAPSTELGAHGENTTQLAFQYFPDSITDSKAINYQQKEIPGGSLPLYQWVNGGERLISFVAQFTTDVDLLTVEGSTGLASVTGGGSTITERLAQAGVSRRNVDIRAAITWLRRYMYPTYANAANDAVAAAQGAPITKAPAKLRLVLPGSGIGLAGACWFAPDSVRTVMTQCDVTYDAFFPSGLPRIASVSLAFAEVPQAGGTIEFPQRTVQLDEVVSGGGASQAQRFTFGYKITPG